MVALVRRPLKVLTALCVPLLLAAILPRPALGQAETPVAVELALAVDTSESVDGFEFALVMKGIADAFRDPEVIERIGQMDGMAVTLFQWSTRVDPRYMVPWHLLRDPASALAFAERVERAERDPLRGFTAIGRAIEFGARQIAGNAFDGRQRKIDVSGDGRNNTGLPPFMLHERTGPLGIVINGLPILTRTDSETADLDLYFRESVIDGAGAFVEVADDYDDFARAFRRKLLREITPVISRAAPAPGAMATALAGEGRPF